MSQVNTFDATFAKQRVIETELGATVRRQVRAVLDGLQHLVSTHVGEEGRSNSQPLSTYYADAYDRTRAATPVTSLGDIFGN